MERLESNMDDKEKIIYKRLFLLQLPCWAITVATSSLKVPSTTPGLSSCLCMA